MPGASVKSKVFEAFKFGIKIAGRQECMKIKNKKIRIRKDGIYMSDQELFVEKFINGLKQNQEWLSLSIG